MCDSLGRVPPLLIGQAILRVVHTSHSTLLFSSEQVWPHRDLGDVGGTLIFWTHGGGSVGGGFTLHDLLLKLVPRGLTLLYVQVRGRYGRGMWHCCQPQSGPLPYPLSTLSSIPYPSPQTTLKMYSYHTLNPTLVHTSSVQSAEITHGSTAPPEVLEGGAGGGVDSRVARVGVALLNNKQVGRGHVHTCVDGSLGTLGP